mgnify:CR=1 FL=1
MQRCGENEKTWFRSERFFHVNDKWYFYTRDSGHEGPYLSKREAELELNLFLRHANDDFYTDTGARSVSG